MKNTTLKTLDDVMYYPIPNSRSQNWRAESWKSGTETM